MMMRIEIVCEKGLERSKQFSWKNMAVEMKI
jgi:hypothetical protein